MCRKRPDKTTENSVESPSTKNGGPFQNTLSKSGFCKMKNIIRN